MFTSQTVIDKNNNKPLLSNEEREWWIVIFVSIYTPPSVNVLKIIRVKNELSSLRTATRTVGVSDRICCGLGNDKFYYRLEYIKNLVPASSQVGGLSLYVWNSESLDFDYNSRRGVIQ